MVGVGSAQCPKCGGRLKHYDKVKRLVRTKYGKRSHIELRRLKCDGCGRVHREIPAIIFPYKQYEAEIVKGVLEGLITPDVLGFEDHPCEMTMLRWGSQNLQSPL